AQKARSPSNQYARFKMHVGNFAFLILAIISFPEGVDNDFGRIGGIFSPIWAAFIAISCVRLERMGCVVAHPGSPETNLQRITDDSICPAPRQFRIESG